ncbi:unnamed protein product [Protopolystoma xenopodis]|uniref:Uncharacterized protein n=1 Tax=Protopolystoma xenopodis TaxID=117903 RepID=A0A448WQX0_9PLAT|nr:unnamed protein product [Protopolystoma xenopodis]
MVDFSCGGGRPEAGCMKEGTEGERRGGKRRKCFWGDEMEAWPGEMMPVSMLAQVAHRRHRIFGLATVSRLPNASSGESWGAEIHQTCHVFDRRPEWDVNGLLLLGQPGGLRQLLDRGNNCPSPRSALRQHFVFVCNQQLGSSLITHHDYRFWGVCLLDQSQS